MKNDEVEACAEPGDLSRYCKDSGVFRSLRVCFPRPPFVERRFMENTSPFIPGSTETGTIGNLMELQKARDLEICR
jgi:hypothetical protein